MDIRIDREPVEFTAELSREEALDFRIVLLQAEICAITEQIAKLGLDSSKTINKAVATGRLEEIRDGAAEVMEKMMR